MPSKTRKQGKITNYNFNLLDENNDFKYQEPYYPLDQLLSVYEGNDTVRGNVDSYVANIVMQGYEVKEKHKLESPKIRSLLELQNYEQKGTITTEAEFKELKKEIELKSKKEELDINLFLTQITGRDSFTDLLEKTYLNYEILGNAYWEIHKNKANKTYKVVNLKAINIRIKEGKEYIEIKRDIETGIGNIKTITDYEDFNIYYDVKQKKFYKEYGDPRILLQTKGVIYPNQEAYEKAIKDKIITKDEALATEVLHFKQVNIADSPYGIPRYISAVISAIMSILQGRTDMMYLNNGSIPDWWINVIGGRLATDTRKALKRELKDRLQRGKTGEPLIIESRPVGGDDGKGVKTEIKELTLKRDDYYLEIDKRNEEKIRTTFRLPKIFTGKVESINRATAYASLLYAEEQVFSPIRNKLDEIINNFLFDSLKIVYTEFYLLGADLRDTETYINQILKMNTDGVIIPNEARKMLNPMLSISLEDTGELWEYAPYKYAQIGIMPTKKMEELDIKDFNGIIEEVEEETKGKDEKGE